MSDVALDELVSCPICEQKVAVSAINSHLDSQCGLFATSTDISTRSAQTISRNSSFNSSTKSPLQAQQTHIQLKLSQSSPQCTQSELAESEEPIVKNADRSSKKRPASDSFVTNNATDVSSKSLMEMESIDPMGMRLNGLSKDRASVSSKKYKLFTDVGEKADQGGTAKRTADKSFGHKLAIDAPLAERARPRNLDEFVGQNDLVNKENGLLRRFIDCDEFPSMILWGPPGVGKTTLARIVASSTKSRFVELSATTAKVEECKKLFDNAKNELRLTRRRTIVFIDELHRFNKSQQDAFLPATERGDIVLIGATTENPSFRINAALLSRVRVFVLQKLTEDNIFSLLKRVSRSIIETKIDETLESQFPSGENITPKASCSPDIITDEALRYLAGLADGDGRCAINLLDVALKSRSWQELQRSRECISVDDVKGILQRTHLLYDRVGDSHYDTISAFHKSVRGSDPDATLFYLARMLEAGEDPLYVARRMIRIASEDVGLADDSCLPFAVSTYEATQKIGMPEANVILAHCAVKLALAPKSVKVYRAYNMVAHLLKTEPAFSSATVPIHLRNAPTKLMKEIGYGKEYKYNPDYVNGIVNQEYLPETIKGSKFLDDIHLGTQLDPDVNENDYPYDEFDEFEVPV
ncbi:hypothetical protein V1511DRAFT_504451 [Dipodascopsis uninucleata]